MLDIVLINPPVTLSKWEIGLGSKLPPLSLAFLAGYLREKGVSVRILDACNLGLSINEVLDYIAQNSPSYVGITATSIMISSAAQLSTEIKKRFPSVTTIIGGAHISALPRETIEHFSCFDVGIFGEGEKTLFEIINSGKMDKTISGIVFRDNGIIVKSDPREYISNLDDLPFPAYDLLNDFPNFYKPTPNNYSCLPVVSVVSSRGCPYSCTFCPQNVFGRNMRSCSFDYLASLIQYLKDKYNAREVCFYDDIFLSSKKGVSKFIEVLEKNKIKIPWSCEGRIGPADDQMYKEMKKAGCWQISFGVESGSQTMLNYFNKKIKVEQISRTLSAVKRAKIRARGYFIVGAPPESMHTLNETKELIQNVPFDDILFSFFSPLPGTPIYQEMIGDKGLDFNKINLFHISYKPENVTEEMLIGFTNKLYKSFYFNPKRLTRYSLMLFNRHKTVHLVKSFIVFLRLIFAKKL